MFSSQEIINGIKVNDRRTWEYLYQYFYPRVVKHVRKNSGNVADAEDLIQIVFMIILAKCTEGFQHDNIKAIIMQKMIWKWKDILRARKEKTVPIMDKDNHLAVVPQFEDEQSLNSERDISKEIELSEDLKENIGRTSNLENFLEYSQLDDLQKRMLEILIDPIKTNPICKKLLVLTHYLPIGDNTLIAEEMGYISSDTPESKKNGLNTLKAQKSRCLKKFKESLGIN